jgi:hypothetical protein
LWRGETEEKHRIHSNCIRTVGGTTDLGIEPGSVCACASRRSHCVASALGLAHQLNCTQSNKLTLWLQGPKVNITNNRVRHRTRTVPSVSHSQGHSVYSKSHRNFMSHLSFSKQTFYNRFLHQHFVCTPYLSPQLHDFNIITNLNDPCKTLIYSLVQSRSRTQSFESPNFLPGSLLSTFVITYNLGYQGRAILNV